MGKEETKVDETKKVDSKETFGNIDGEIETLITNHGLMNTDLLKAAADQIADKEKKVKVNEAASILCENKYERARLLILVRYHRGISKAVADKLKALTSLNEDFSKGTKSVRDYVIAKDVINKAYDESLKSENKKNRDLISQLQEQFTDKNVASSFGEGDWYSGEKPREEEKLPEAATKVDGKDDEVNRKAERVARNAANEAEMNRR
jgi:hypothetical protein